MKVLGLFLLFYFFSTSCLSQYQHRLELNTAAGFTRIYDIRNIKIGDITLPHETLHSGLGINISLSYQLTNLPIFLTVNASSYRIRNPDYNPQILTTTFTLSELSLNSIDFSGEIYLFKSKPFNPYIGVGLMITNFDVDRSFERYKYIPEPDPNFITVEEIEWEYDGITAQFTNVGFFHTLGLRYRLNDRFGINGGVKFVYYKNLRNISLSDVAHSTTFTVGTYFKIFKLRKYLL